MMTAAHGRATLSAQQVSLEGRQTLSAQHAVTQHAVALSISATARQVQCSSSPVCTILRFYGLSIREVKNFGCFGNHLPETRPTFQRHSCFMTAIKCRQLLHQQAVRRGSAHFRSRTMETSMNHAQSLQTIPSGAGRHFILKCCVRLCYSDSVAALTLARFDLQL